MSVLVWFRNDLRIHDNPALTAALQSKMPVIACYIATPEQWRRHDMAPIKAQFICQNLRVLSDNLADLNIPLLINRAPDFQDCAQTLNQWIHQHGVTRLYFNREYAVNEVLRDRQLSHQLSQDCTIHNFHDQCVVQPGAVLTQSSQPYRVFTPFSRAWHQHPDAQNCQLLPTPKPQSPIKVARDPISDQDFSLASQPPDIQGWPAGEDAALKRMEAFAQERMSDYKRYRDFPDLDATSGLSPYLALGIVSPRACYKTALAAKKEANASEGVSCWINELIWREFYIHLIYHYPDLCKYRAFKQETEALPWRQDDEGFQAWCEGRTGIPIVDAAMRQLQARGWMHNRLRMICAMFLSKNLLIDWRRGERFFMQNLIDGHLASNNGGWQWAASTGTDAAPYFRIFNPVTQSQKFDPEGSFIKRYVPELRSLEGKKIHSPHLPTVDSDIDYPLPIVDLKSSRQRAIDAFQALS